METWENNSFLGISKGTEKEIAKSVAIYILLATSDERS